MEHAKRTAHINGLNITYCQFGSGVPLLFLHGGRVRARTFRRLLVLLSKKYTVIAPDIPGFGGSDTPTAAWSFADYAVFFDDFLSHLNITQATVMGYSMGGGIALNLAAMSKRTACLVLIDASGINRKDKGSYHDMRRLRFYLTHPSYTLAFAVLVRDYAQYIWKHRGDRAHMKRIRQTCFETSNSKALRNITVPTRLLWGSDDWIYPLTVAHEFQKRISQATLETVPGNHDWPVYNPLLISQLMI
jgi:pimeloyl-ACP methyl ester carboxylesterase